MYTSVHVICYCTCEVLQQSRGSQHASVEICFVISYLLPYIYNMSTANDSNVPSNSPAIPAISASSISPIILAGSPVSDDIVVPEVKHARKKAKRTQAQKASAKENTTEMWDAIGRKREAYASEIKALAGEFNRWIAHSYLHLTYMLTV
jgi:hypothetical protein